MSGRDGTLQTFVLLPTTRGFALEPGVEAATRDRQEPAHGLHRKMESSLFHERVPGSDSLAKYAVAFFKMSRSRRASASSLRSRLFSCSRSIAVRLPACAFCGIPRLAATQLAKVPFGIARRLAASPCVKPCSVNYLTASSRNSGE